MSLKWLKVTLSTKNSFAGRVMCTACVWVHKKKPSQAFQEASYSMKKYLKQTFNLSQSYYSRNLAFCGYTMLNTFANTLDVRVNHHRRKVPKLKVLPPCFGALWVPYASHNSTFLPKKQPGLPEELKGCKHQGGTRSLSGLFVMS